MLDKPKITATNSSNRLAIAVMMGMSVLGCREEVKEIIDLPPRASAAAPASVSKPPEIPRCERKITCEDQEAFTPRKNIQQVLNRFRGAESFIESFSGNGCRDVIVFRPDGFDSEKPAELIFHFHGAHGNLIGVPVPYDTSHAKEGKKSKGKKRLTQVLSVITAKVKRSNRNAILIYPISAGRRGDEDTTGYKFGYDEVWMQENNASCDSMERLDAEVRDKIKARWEIDVSDASVTVTGHSAGGLAILRIAQSGYRPDRIKFLDSSYDFWAEETYENLIGSGGPLPILLYVKPHTSTHEGASRIEGKPKVLILPSMDPDKEHGDFVNDL